MRKGFLFLAGVLFACGVGAEQAQTSLALSESAYMAPLVDKVQVKKASRLLILLKEGKPLRVYPIALGDKPLGHKQFEGDERTPEGTYSLDWRNPNSAFHKSIHVSYPNDQDVEFAKSQGREPGGMIMIHGWPNGFNHDRDSIWLYEFDWTDGCIAVNNQAMDEIWSLVPDGTPIEILP
ncbi:L,D-transpeptidase family protein [Hahella sp. CR1]|uniref:L,D-transpeptidase family protein n=1 Tax=unclassified Hahella TaxID=2624107 RepID=UPI002441E142|nr:L,D-transpeptidase family protein [Hahella sp. CR1]MDG9667054.1 L,D-transpeptidase family protein [Hahella sp. CR1]